MDPHGDLTADDVHHVAFSKPPFGERGYDEDEVDEFLENLRVRLTDPRAYRQPTATDVALTRFAKPPIGKRGYNEGEVDELRALAVRTLEKFDGAVPFRTPSRPVSTPVAHAYEAPPLDTPRKKWWRFW